MVHAENSLSHQGRGAEEHLVATDVFELKRSDEREESNDSLQATFTKAILENAREIFGEETVSTLPMIKAYNSTNTPASGEAAIKKSYSGSIGRIATALELGMKAPELIYASGYLFLSAVDAKIDPIKRRLDELGLTRKYQDNNGVRNVKKEAEVREEEKKAIEELTIKKERLNAMLEAKLGDNFKGEDGHKKKAILQKLVRPVRHDGYTFSHESLIKRVLKLYSYGHIDEAYNTVADKNLYYRS